MSSLLPVEAEKGIYTIDLETTIHEKYGPAPQYHGNKIVYLGIVDGTKDNPRVFSDRTSASISRSFGQYTSVAPVLILQGHNIKFDLLYLMKEDPQLLYKLIKNGTILWDTMIVEYLLTAQSAKNVKLNDLILKYLGSSYVKDDEITSLFKQGIGADKIPSSKICPYLINDVVTTAHIGAEQRRAVGTILKYMSNLIVTQMDALAAITEMEHNGFCIDAGRLGNLISEYSVEVDTLESIIKNNISSHLPVHMSKIKESDLGVKFLNAYLYGGDVTIPHTEQAVDKDGNLRVYKTGARKGQKVMKTVEIKLKLLAQVRPHVQSLIKALNKDNKLSVDDSALDLIILHETNGDVVSLAHALKNYRASTKMLGTYLKPISEKMMPNGFLYGSINQTTTATGRTSSSNPNLQNMPSSDASPLKEVFVSRYGKWGTLVEFDYKQLEVVALALLSQCPALTKALHDGEDIHVLTGKKVHGAMYVMSHDERRTIKSVNFGLIYGGAAKGIAQANGLDVKLVKEIIAAFYKLFPGVAKWHKEYHEATEHRTVYLTGRNKTDGKPEHALAMKQPTGRLLEYTIYENNWGPDGPSATQLKNYPVQSLATADIVPMMLGELLKAIVMNDLYDDVKLVCTVHDSILLDVRKEVLTDAIAKTKLVLESVPYMLEKKFGIKTDLPFRVEVKAGPNWKDMTEIKC